ncbi:hypothetical protein Dimus_039350 [Dionaea muscipula]
MSHVGKISINHQVSSFVSGLKETIRTYVQVAAPLTLTEAVGLAKLHETKVLSQKRTSFSIGSRPLPIGPQPITVAKTSVRASTPPVKRLTGTEMQIRRENGLCFNCDEKSAPCIAAKDCF